MNTPIALAVSGAVVFGVGFTVLVAYRLLRNRHLKKTHRLPGDS